MQNLQYLGVFSWKDPVEILFFSWLIYRFSLWLKENQTHTLLILFYRLCLLLICSHFFQFTTINSFFFLYGPACIMLFILVHQETLQQNFVTMKKIKPLKNQTQANWLEVLLRTCLRTQNAHKSFICIIEQSDELSLLLEAPFFMKNTITDDLLVLLLESPHLNPEKLVWLSQDGTINAVNALWKKPIDQTWLADNVKNQEAWIANAIMTTQKTDALVFKSNAQSGTFDVVAQGKLIEHLSATNTLRIIRHYLNVGPQAIPKKGDPVYEKSQHKKSTVEQSHH
jgi:hypothetical protein